MQRHPSPQAPRILAAIQRQASSVYGYLDGCADLQAGKQARHGRPGTRQASQAGRQRGKPAKAKQGRQTSTQKMHNANPDLRLARICPKRGACHCVGV